MANPNKSPAGAVTVQHDFCSTGINGKDSNDQDLFSVRAGVPLSSAIEQLSVLVNASICNLDHLACEGDDTETMPAALWQSIHLLNFSQALIQSIHHGQIAHIKGQA